MTTTDDVERDAGRDERDERPPRYVERAGRPAKGELDTVVYRASSLGMCERAIVAIANNVPRAPWPAKFQEVLDEGTAYEDTIRQMHAAEHGDGDGTAESQALIELEVGELYGRRVIVRAHADDVIGNSLEGYVLREYKKFRDSTWPNFVRMGVEVHVNYPWQVAAMMHGLSQINGKLEDIDVVCEFVGGHLVDGAIVETSHTLLAIPPIPLKAIRLRLARLERMINEGLAPDEVACTPQYPCGFWNMPWTDGCNKGMADDGDGDLPEIAATEADVKRYALLSLKSSDLAKQLKTIDAERKALVKAITVHWPAEPDADNPVKKVRVGDMVITRIRSHYAEQVRKAYNTDTLKIGDAD